MLSRALLAFITLPGVIAFVVPLLIAWPRVREGSFNLVALVLLIPGITLLLWCVRDFFVTGKGTLAPWDPTSNLVAVGPYRYTRNPMITGVCTILTGEAIAVGSWRLAVWALTFIVFNHIHFLLIEEPGLEERFGKPYRDYKNAVPRWIPRRPR